MNAPQLLATALLSTALSAGAFGVEAFRCRNSIVEAGLTAAEVLAKCGEPDSRNVLSQPIRARGVGGASYIVGTTTIEHWVYERRPGQFPAYLTFDQGRLKEIELLERR